MIVMIVMIDYLNNIEDKKLEKVLSHSKLISNKKQSCWFSDTIYKIQAKICYLDYLNSYVNLFTELLYLKWNI